MNENVKVVLKLAVYVGVPVLALIALIWLRTFHRDIAWVQNLWKGVWLIGVPIMILVGGYIVMRANDTTDNTDESG